MTTCTVPSPTSDAVNAGRTRSYWCEYSRSATRRVIAICPKPWSTRLKANAYVTSARNIE